MATEETIYRPKDGLRIFRILNAKSDGIEIEYHSESPNTIAIRLVKNKKTLSGEISLEKNDAYDFPAQFLTVINTSFGLRSKLKTEQVSP